MTVDEARTLLGPAVVADIEARPTRPLTDEQIALLVPVLTADPHPADAAA